MEGNSFQENEKCTLACPVETGKAPVFAELVCKKGELHPPGFLQNVFWSDWDMANGFKVECAERDEVPGMIFTSFSDFKIFIYEKLRFKVCHIFKKIFLAPGIKRGMSIWNHGKQADFYKTYSTIHNNPQNYTMGWFYVWNVNSNWYAFTGEGNR